MTPEEFEYIKRAVAALESGEYNKISEVKILQTISEICGKNATIIKNQIGDGINSRLARNYYDLQNQKLVDILSR